MTTVARIETLVDAMRQHCAERGSVVAYTFLANGEEPGVDLSYQQLDTRAVAIAEELRSRGASGEPVLVLCAPGPDYVAALLGCFYAGAVAVPAYPPTRTTLARAASRIRTIAENAGTRIALTAASDEANGHEWAEALGALESIDVAQFDGRLGASGAQVSQRPQPEAPALLQYTSGSTSLPKGVLLTHAQIVANLEMLRVSGAISPSDVFVSWLPPFHDMGLIGALLLPLFAGARCISMPPEAFVRKPRRWLEAASRRRASILIAPNFAFEVCTRRIQAEQRTGLDLSSIRILYNGAEPIAATTIETFSREFAPFGFSPEAFYPCYGMAEATLIVSGGAPGAGPVIREYLAERLEQGYAERTQVSGKDEETRTRTLVGCGGALQGERIAIVETSTRVAVAAGRVGEIWLQSASVALGYWQMPEATADAFRAYTADGEGPFLRTGDLGFFDQGELFITGRLKDLIIVRGLNHHPQDIERTVQGLHEALVADAGAAFSIDRGNGEELVVVQEFDKRVGLEPEVCLAWIPEAIRHAHELAPATVVLIKRGSLGKTSSGKVQRRATKDAYLAGELKVIAEWHATTNASPTSITTASANVSVITSDSVDRTGRAAATASSVADGDEPEAARDRTHTRPVSRNREQLIADWLRTNIATRVRCAPDEIDPSEPLARYGVDSLVAAELTDELERWLGLQVPTTLSYDNPTIATLARALASLGQTPPRARRLTPELAARGSAQAREPIAIVGMACRFPGAPSLKGFWTLLRHGVDAITEVPAERWDASALYDPEPGTRGKICNRSGGFVEQIDRFDASFFGISEREAARIDPQQRMFLEVAWEALEDAGQSPPALSGSSTGVFAGVCSSDYATLYGGDLSLIDADYGTGNAPSVVANRLSYFLDLKGPSETIDTACSSSLVAIQHACRSLRNEDCELAIVGGVNALLAPESSVYFSQLRALAKDGRCKVFDSRADGFVRSEGAGVVVLKPLSKALADGDRIYALVEGSAVNHDGRSNGLTAPHGLAQQEVVRRALDSASITPDELDYVEAHGVGTPVADAVELNSLGAVLGLRAVREPLLVGSAKTNVGHLEAASGMVSVIKVALALHHEEIPPHLHLHDVHPDIDLDVLPIAIPTTAQPWRRSQRTRFSGVSSFGFGGTNAHVILREAPASRAIAASAARGIAREPSAHAQSSKGCERPRHLLTLSARTPQALRDIALRYVNRIGSLRGESLADLCFSANVGRAHFNERLATSAIDADTLRGTLERFARSGRDAGSHNASVNPGARLGLAFVFAESKNAIPAVGQALYETQPQFRAALDTCERWLLPHLERPLTADLYGGSHDQRAACWSEPSFAHAALVSLQCSLHTLLIAWGLAPSAVHGQGAGEYAAAAAAGVLPWEQAIVLAWRRGLVLEGLSAGASQRLSVRQFKEELATHTFALPTISFVSASLGRAFAGDEIPDAAHFGRQLYHAPDADSGREARAALTALGCDAHVVVGPPASSRSSTPDRSSNSELVGASELALLSDAGDDWRSLLDALAALYTRGADIDWRAFDSPYPRRKLSLPSYPFQRQRYWLDFPKRNLGSAEPEVIERASSHPLISRIRIHAPARSGFVRRENANDASDGVEGDGSSSVPDAGSG